jgi:putative ABC transport system substrate-binding protein
VTNNSSLRKKGVWVTTLILIVVGSLFLSGCGAQIASKTYRVGILSGHPAFAAVADGFIAQMDELGYVEGKNIVYDLQETGSDAERMKEISQKFVADEVDLILTITHGAALAAKAATEGTDIPVVFAIAQTEDATLVENVRNPGGNITGVRYPGPDLAAKRLELLLEIAPQTKRVYATYRSEYPAALNALETGLRPAVSTTDVTLVEVPIASVDDLKADLQARASADDIGFDAILILPEPLSQSPDGWAEISAFAVEHKLPIGGSAAIQYERGAVFTYNIDNVEVGGLAGPLVDKVLNGVEAGSIPIVTPESYLRINHKQAQELGLIVPDGLLLMADEVIRE